MTYIIEWFNVYLNLIYQIWLNFQSLKIKFNETKNEFIESFKLNKFEIKSVLFFYILFKKTLKWRKKMPRLKKKNQEKEFICMYSKRPASKFVYYIKSKLIHICLFDILWSFFD